MSVFQKDYNVNGDMLTLVEWDKHAWLLWASTLGKIKAGGMPVGSSLPTLRKNMRGPLNGSTLKGRARTPDGVERTCWLIDLEGIIEILGLRKPRELAAILSDMKNSFCNFQYKIDHKTDELPDSGGSETENPAEKDGSHSPSTDLTESPQTDQETVDESPEDEDVKLPESVEDVCKLFDSRMAGLVKDLSIKFAAYDETIQELEVVKYADQLGDMAGRLSAMEEQLHGYEQKLRDFHLLIRSLKEATGSQVQADIIMKLVGMIEVRSDG